MDLNKFDTTKKADAGVFLALEFCGEVVKTEGGEVVGLMVKGSTSHDFKARLKTIKKRQADRVRLRKNGKVTGLENAASEQQELYASAVSEYVNITVDGEDWSAFTPTIGKTVTLFERFSWIEDLVVECVDDDENYLGES